MSAGEDAFAYYVRVFGLPEPVRELRFAPPRRWRFDFAWPVDGGGGVAVEIDGGRWQTHGGRHAGDADKIKLNRGSALGWEVYRYSPQMLQDDAMGCITEVKAALERRGIH